MANFVYTVAKAELLKGTLDFDLPNDIRVLLVGPSTTADTQEDALTISGFTTLDELTGGGYARQALANEAVARDDVNNRGEFDADNAVFTALGPTTPTSCQAAVVYKHVTTDADSIPLAYIDTGGFPFTPNGGDVTIQWNAEGIIQTT